ncbi:FkbM family methyltransferase [Mucisphaera calidilacus]|uniref:Methyltransferase FkbM domain-containing protein n=1 Tax=Mucisphaera calidilacus TaxID=2527982 RepID=A0A518BV00_9BACT|nr:FkbM family methyltransferase [Mucisphaera calidilacus]QDU70791.1 hypothetical protein Pan265_06280 [Mucisphaera calidilacus]
MSAHPLAVRLSRLLLPRLRPRIEPRPVPGWVLGSGEQGGGWQGWLRRRLLRSFKRPVDVTWIDGLRLTAYPYNEVTRSILMTGLYDPTELSWLRRTLTPGMTFIDGGANLGLYSLIASRCVGDDGRVLAFEPSGREYDRACHHVALNQLENVTVLRAALADRPGRIGIKIADEKHAGHNTLGGFVYHATQLDRVEQVEATTLDDAVREHNLTRVDVVKLDLEGSEHAALQGAAQTLERYRPVLLMEFSDPSLRAQGSSAEALRACVESFGYRLGRIENDDADFEPLPDTSSLEASVNVVAMPREAARRAA